MRELCKMSALPRQRNAVGTVLVNRPKDRSVQTYGPNCLGTKILGAEVSRVQTVRFDVSVRSVIKEE